MSCVRKVLGPREEKEAEMGKWGKKEGERKTDVGEEGVKKTMCQPLEMSIPVFPSISERKQVNLFHFAWRLPLD